MKYTCPVCGYKTFDEEPGSYDLCHVCGWEDDLSQLRFVTTTGANSVSLIDAQKNFTVSGLAEVSRTETVIPPNSSFLKDPLWRTFDTMIDKIEEPVRGRDYGGTYPDDSTDLYYWKR